ncbi:MAG: PspC domain-containing protein [Anaerolineae bacterium]|nr:PspC domain-containing protein [Anaerolineae bacterium]
MNFQKRLCCSSQNRMFVGVCGGIAEYLNIDPTLVRLIFVAVALILLGFETAMFIYFTLWVIMPGSREEKEKRKNDFISDH